MKRYWTVCVSGITLGYLFSSPSVVSGVGGPACEASFARLSAGMPTMVLLGGEQKQLLLKEDEEEFGKHYGETLVSAQALDRMVPGGVLLLLSTETWYGGNTVTPMTYLLACAQGESGLAEVVFSGAGKVEVDEGGQSIVASEPCWIIDDARCCPSVEVLRWIGRRDDGTVGVVDVKAQAKVERSEIRIGGSGLARVHDPEILSRAAGAYAYHDRHGKEIGTLYLSEDGAFVITDLRGRDVLNVGVWDLTFTGNEYYQTYSIGFRGMEKPREILMPIGDFATTDDRFLVLSSDTAEVQWNPATRRSR